MNEQTKWRYKERLYLLETYVRCTNRYHFLFKRILLTILKYEFNKKRLSSLIPVDSLKPSTIVQIDLKRTLLYKS